MNYQKNSEIFISKIATLSDTIWEGRVREPQIISWLNNFKDENERINVLYLLSMFMYFGYDQIKAILKAVFRDLYKYPIIEEIRRNNSDTIDIDLINRLFDYELERTRFLGLGNPSESGAHLLYTFRQENELPKHLFIHEHEILKREDEIYKLTDPNIIRYVFIDDFCGSGNQALLYSENNNIKVIKEINSEIKVYYYPLFSTSDALNKLRYKSDFDKVQCIVELDSNYKCFSEESRYWKNVEDFLDKKFTEKICQHYGTELMEIICKLERVPVEYAKFHSLGFRDGQLMIGFHHNTPDNTMPIFWFNNKNYDWSPIFKRYNKIY